MWHQITPADIQKARDQLQLRRTEMLRRHAEELKDLDAQLHDVQAFEGILAAFIEEYMTPGTAPTERTAAASGEQARPAATPDANQPLIDAQPTPPSLDLEIRQHVSPVFDHPPRLRFLGR